MKMLDICTGKFNNLETRLTGQINDDFVVFDKNTQKDIGDYKIVKSDEFDSLYSKNSQRLEHGTGPKGDVVNWTLRKKFKFYSDTDDATIANYKDFPFEVIPFKFRFML
jgi:hypothetical protein